MNWLLVTMMGISIVLLFIVMMLSVWAASDVADTNDNAHKYSTYAAILSGLSVGAISIALGVYIYLVRKGYKI